jgi:hypothetical protein
MSQGQTPLDTFSKKAQSQSFPFPHLLKQVFHRRLFWGEFNFVDFPVPIMHPNYPEHQFPELA